MLREHPGQRGRRKWRRLPAVLAGIALVAGSVVPALVLGPAANAESLASLRAQAAAIAAQLNADYTRLDILDEQFNNAVTRLDQLTHDVAADTAALAASRGQLRSDEARLRTVAIASYVSDGASNSLSLLMSGNSSEVPEQQAYLQAASGNIDNAVATVERAAHAVQVKEVQMSRQERAAATAERLIAADRQSTQRETAVLQATLANVKGRLATAVAAMQAAAAKEAAARDAAAAAAASKKQPPAPTSPPVTTGAGNGAGAVAVRAAESQLGVPYVYGGATPGVGFDCSGLTMWAWAQAGVQLAHGATDQYYEIPHVSMSDLQPGDLIFYGDASYLYHVVMYVGSGPYGADTVIQAEHTGTNVMYSPIPGGAYGAGQP
jgi:cell wall-associated NlpC family hydrolase